MKIWSGIVTPQLHESKRFYVDLFGCEVLFESEWFVLLSLGGGELGLLAPGLDSQAPVFQAPLRAQPPSHLDAQQPLAGDERVRREHAGAGTEAVQQHQPAPRGPGVWVCIDVDDVDAHYERLQRLGVGIEHPLRDEPWGDRHFVVLDPNGVGVDVVQRPAS